MSSRSMRNMCGLLTGQGRASCVVHVSTCNARGVKCTNRPPEASHHCARTHTLTADCIAIEQSSTNLHECWIPSHSPTDWLSTMSKTCVTSIVLIQKTQHLQHSEKIDFDICSECGNGYHRIPITWLWLLLLVHMPRWTGNHNHIHSASFQEPACNPMPPS